MTVRKIAIEPNYRKPNGMFVLGLDRAPELCGFPVNQSTIVSLPPGTLGGNHQHARHEAFIGLGADLEIAWLDPTGKRHSQPMNPDGQLFLFVVPPHLPHAIRNLSPEHPATLLEYASVAHTQADVTPVQVV